MRITFWKVIVLPAALFFLLSAAPSFQLKPADVRKSMDEMMSLHVEYKELTPFLARRSLKIFVEQFDPERTYLLASEVKPFLDPRDELLKEVIARFKQDDLTVFDKESQMIYKAILRAKEYRREIAQELIASDVAASDLSPESYGSYAQSEQELRSRMKRQLQKILLLEQRESGSAQWNTERRKKVFALWERRFNRFEAGYLPVDGMGKPLSRALLEHYLSIHTLKAMAKSLDAHTSYFSPEEAFEMRAALEKQFEGIGVVLREGVDGVVISDMIKGGPAARSGKIASGDLLVEVDGKSVVDAPYEEVLKRLQGEGKGKVQLGLKRVAADHAPSVFQVELQREKIIMQDERLQYSFEPFADGIIGKLDLPSFYESGEGSSCELDMREALRALKKEGKLLGLVLDMRYNSGGFLNQAVKVAGLFISSGVIVISKYSQGEIQYLRDLDGRSYYTGPLVILTSKASASAAEIVAQALQDYGTAIVVGDERTYGKGTIQYQTVTDGGASSFFKVTVGRYYTVSGRSTQIDGVQADMLVPTVYSAYNIGERYLEFPLKSDRIPSAYIDPLTDVDPRNQAWFQRNYLPNLQKKLSMWTQMLPQLKENSAFRLAHNKDFELFLNTIQSEKKSKSYSPTPQQNWGVEDLQLLEAVNIIKDMTILAPSAAKNSAALWQQIDPPFHLHQRH
jgi:carboxyl-terminal processing protease